MNFPWEVVFLSLFYMAIFLVICSVVTSSVKQVIKTYYETKLSYRVSVVRQVPEREKQLI